ncbi:MAG TPA: TorF family putative porin, partial [Tepidisphaeraceae bacterium]
LGPRMALAAALAAPTFAMAEKPNTGGLTFTGSVDVASNYYFRGYLQENEGLILQPAFSIATKPMAFDDFSVGLTLSTWNSFHSENTLSDGDGAGAWYENDIYGQVPITVGKFIFTPIYTLYQYPNGAFETIQEVGATLSFDDTGAYTGLGSWAEGLALKPYIAAYYEIDDAGGEENGYWEVGIAPGYTFDLGQFSLPLTFPIMLAGGWDDFYTDSDGDNETLGYLQVGVTTSIPLPIPEEYGVWSVNAGGYYQYLIADSAEAANNDSNDVFWGKIGISFVY